MSVLYVYRCPTCGHRGEVHHPDDSYHGAAASCAACYGPVKLEWDGGVTFEVGMRSLRPGVAGGPHAVHPVDERVAPTPDALKHLRQRHGRTQAQAAALLGVEPRQVQRWEAGEAKMPIASWQLLRREWGTRFREDFTTVFGPTWGWDTQRDVRRHTIECGDVVHLQAINGPLIVATVCADRAYDARADVHVYGAIVTGVGGSYSLDTPLERFNLGERVTFARANVIHLEQRLPVAGAR
ncbi:helix-turn-helix domain-containing protein [Burkholderia cenocepacia]|uniref:helix-turn-helix domain-containing protein n=1 Tax=Burkholderia cenocepacia TaxID=95486 RepID=UPI00223217C3|nr:helix-turn-helix domain-containing protein [Burkholderia cenocepacia]MCW3609127.1 helix-turn-helix domain-containing protein [Burkholderia cenocepacia]MCW5189852.1 helix-turn-helix domain-containing protein [Burkholderia cenocepacia]